MVIQYNSLPFRFELINELNDGSKRYRDIAFCDNIDDINKNVLKNVIEIRENTIVTIRLTSENLCRLEMDGFDGLNIDIIKHDDGIYLKSSDKPLQIFSYKEFPLPPGLYIIKVQVKGSSYYTSFQVTTLRFDEKTWEIMARDVFESIKLMAFQMSIQKMNVANSIYINESMGSLLLKMNVIDKYFNNAITTLKDISLNPHSKISKKYTITNIADCFATDFNSNKLNSKKFYLRSEYVPIKYTDYQLNENVYMKRVIVNLDNIIRLFLIEIGEKKEYLYTKIENDYYGKKNKTAEYNRNQNSFNFLRKYYLKAKKIKRILDIIKNMGWLKTINENTILKLPSQSMIDPRYAILNKISKDLRAQNVKYDINNRLSFIWHNSSKLYELWGILKIVEAFQKLGFLLKEGLNVEKYGSELKINGLSSADSFLLKKEDIEVKISYEAKLYRKEFRDKTSVDTEPVYTIGKHDSPDCKIDFFFIAEEKKYYISSLIIDFKYRTRESILSCQKCQEQLVSYVEDIRSLYVSMYNQNRSLSERPVKAVWALYPNRYNHTAEDINEEIYLKLISFVPGYQDIIEKHIEEFMETYISESIEIIKIRIFSNKSKSI